MINALQVCNLRMVCICKGEGKGELAPFMLQLYLIHLPFIIIVKTKAQRFYIIMSP